MTWIMPAVFILLIVGVMLWALSAFPAIDPTIKSIIKVVIIVLAVIWTLTIVFGHYGWMPR